MRQISNKRKEVISVKQFFLAILFYGVSTFSLAADNYQNLLKNSDFQLGKTGWVFNSRPMDAALEFIPQPNAPFGSIAARISVGELCRLASLGSNWVTLKAGQDYTFSVFLRSEQESVVPVTLSVWSWADAGGRWNTRTESRKTVEVSSEWQRFSVVANLDTARAGKYQVLIEIAEPAVVYVNGAMLTGGKEVLEINLGPELEFGMDFPETTMFFEYGTPISYNLKFINRTELQKKLIFDYTITDFYDNLVLSEQIEVVAVPGLGEQFIELPIRQKGYYKVSVTAKDSKNSFIGEEVAAFSIIQKNTAKGQNQTSPFGVSISPNRLELALERADLIGVEHLRVHEVFNWRDFEPEKGIFIWDKLGGGLATSAKTSTEFYKPAIYDFSVYTDKGFKPTIYVQGHDRFYPEWARGYDEEAKLLAYGKFFKQFASNFSGVIENFQIINEPWKDMGSTEYFELLRSTYSMAKKGNPDATVIGVTGYHGPQINFLKEIIDLGGLDYMDVLALHPYPRPEAPERVLIEFLHQTREWMEQAGRVLPLWITEIGWTTLGFETLPTRIPRPAHRNNTDIEQAQYLVRTMVISVANGVEVIHWFHYSGDHTFRYTYHMFEADSFASPMKTVPVFSALSQMLSQARFTRTLVEGEGSLFAYEFEEEDEIKIVAWTESDQSTLLLETGAGSFKVFDIMGNELMEFETAGGVSAVPVTGSAVYLVGSDGVFDQVNAINPVLVEIEAPRGQDTYKTTVSLTNIWGAPATVSLDLILPIGVVTTKDRKQNISLGVGDSKTLELPLVINSPLDALTEKIIVAASIETEGQRYHFSAWDQLRYVKPLPKPEAGIWMEAEFPTSISFESSPEWMPNQFRSYGGDHLRIRPFGKVESDDFLITYEFEVSEEGDYVIMIASSRLNRSPEREGLPSLSWKIGDAQNFEYSDSKEVGKPWIYSTHRNIWWRFRSVWHDMGTVRLEPGQQKLTIRLGTPADLDYNYLIIDAIAVLNKAEAMQFQNKLNK